MSRERAGNVRASGIQLVEMHRLHNAALLDLLDYVGIGW